MFVCISLKVCSMKSMSHSNKWVCSASIAISSSTFSSITLISSTPLIFIPKRKNREKRLVCGNVHRHGSPPEFGHSKIISSHSFEEDKVCALVINHYSFSVVAPLPVNVCIFYLHSQPVPKSNYYSLHFSHHPQNRALPLHRRRELTPPYTGGHGGCPSWVRPSLTRMSCPGERAWSLEPSPPPLSPTSCKEAPPWGRRAPLPLLWERAGAPLG